MQLALWELEGLQNWQKAPMLQLFQALAEKMEVKLKDVMLPFFVAVTGQASSVPVMDAMVHLGPDMTRYRLRQAIDLLGGVSKKMTKKLEKQRLSLHFEKAPES